MKSIRLICAAAFAAVALTAAAGASPAAASYLALGEYPAMAEGTSNGSMVMTVAGKAVECGGIDFWQTQNGPVQELDTDRVAEASNCSWSSYSGQLDLKSCDFVLHPGNPSGSVEIGPAACGGATLTLGECTWSIPAQKGIATNYANNATEPASASMQTSGSFSLTVVKGSSGFCGKGTLSGGLYSNWTISAGVAGSPVSATVTDHPSVGIFLSSNQLAAESYPVALSGTQSAAAKRTFDFGGRTVTCSEASVAGNATGSSSKFTVSPSYSGCSAVVLGNPVSATVDASGCTEAYSVTASKAPYTASLDLNCSSPLKVVLTAGEQLCTYTVASQSGLGTINLANTGKGSARGVDVQWQIGALAYTRTSGSLVTCGKASGSATANGTVQLHGSI